MDFETLIWLAVIAFWIFGLGRGKKSAKRRTGVPGQSTPPTSAPPGQVSEPVSEAPASLEEALRQIREALGEASAPAPRPEPAPSAPSPVSSTGTFHESTKPQPRDIRGERPARIAERTPPRSPSRRVSEEEAESPFRSAAEATFDNRFRDKSGLGGSDFVNLEESIKRRAARPLQRWERSLASPGDQSHPARAETQAEVTIRAGSPEDLRQAIIWTEILGPPKSRR